MCLELAGVHIAATRDLGSNHPATSKRVINRLLESRAMLRPPKRGKPSPVNQSAQKEQLDGVEGALAGVQGKAHARHTSRSVDRQILKT